MDLIGHIASGHVAGDSTAGGASYWLRAAPGSFYRAKDITNERKELGDSAPAARPQKTGAGRSARNEPAAVLNLNG